MKLYFHNEIGLVPCLSYQKVPMLDGRVIPAFCLACDYADKAKAKAWAQKHNGSWHPVLKVWWIPVTSGKNTDIPILQELIELGFFKTHINIWLDDRLDKKVNEKFRGFFSSIFESKKPKPLTVYGIQMILPEEDEYNYDPHYYIAQAETEVAQPQGFIDFPEKQNFRILLSYEPQQTPDDAFERIMGVYWRKLKTESGDTIWAYPWENPKIKTADPWPDHNFNEVDDTVEVEKPKAIEPDLEIGLICDKEGKKIGFSVKTLAKFERWDICYAICKRFGSEWKPDKKYWVFSLEKLKEKDRKECIEILSDCFDGIGNYQRGTTRIKNLKANFTDKATEYLNEWIDIFWPEENEVEITNEI